MNFRHINLASTFNVTKFSSNKSNTRYFIGNNTSKVITGVPTVLYDELVFCKEYRIIYTHGALYRVQEGSYLEQVENLDDYLQAPDGKIVEYIGQTDGDYINGYIYRNVITEDSVPVHRILTTSNENLVPQGEQFFFKDELSDVVYVGGDYYSFSSPIIGTKVYKATTPVEEYKITSSVRVTAGYKVNIESITGSTTETELILKNLAPTELWSSVSGIKLIAAPNKTLTGIVKEVEGGRIVNVTSQYIQDKSNYWEQVIPSNISSCGGFTKIKIGDYTIDSSNQDSINLVSGEGIKIECINSDVVISRLSEIKDDITSNTSTWSSDKISKVISSFGSNNFIMVEELPTTDIRTDAIYIVPREKEEEKNKWNEYIYIDNEWEWIGNTDVDLSNYYNKEDINTLLSNKQNKLTAIGVVDISDNRISVNLTDYYNRGDVDTRLNLKQDIITGSNGEVVYHNGSYIFTQSVMCDGYVVDNEEDLAKCKNFSPSFETVFNTWNRFSHLNGNINAVPSEITAWRYSNNTVIQPLNTTSYVGFVSPRSYSNYNVTVRCFATGADNDTIGLVAAFAKDSDGKEHTLSFVRTTGGTTTNGKPLWAAVLDLSQFSIRNDSSMGQYILVSKQSTFPTTSVNWNSSEVSSGTVINITRKGNKFTAKCSDFGSSVLDNNTTITVELTDELCNQYPVLNLFKGSSPWGYSCISQPNSQYENISVTDPSALIYDVVHNSVWSYSPSTSSWEIVPGSNPIDEVGIGRFSYNQITDKLFFNNGYKLVRLAHGLSAGNNVTIVNDTISAPAPANNGKLTIKQGTVSLGEFTANQSGDTNITIPVPTEPNDGTLSIKQGDALLGTFNANQSGNVTVNIPVPPTVNDGTLTVKQGETVLGSFTANQLNNTIVNIPVPSTVNDGTLTVKQGDTVLGSFTANQLNNTTVNIPVPPVVNNGTLTVKQGSTTIGTFSANQSGNTDIVIPAPPVVNNGTLTVKQGDTVLGSFTANQEGDITISIEDPEASDFDIKDLNDVTNLRNTWSNKQDKISGTGVISVNDNVVSADLSDYETVVNVDTKLATKQNTISGQEGEIVYHNGTDVFTQTLMSSGYVVNTNEDLAKCKLTNPSFSDVFTSWNMFSHTTSGDNSSADDMAGWSYVESANTINQSRNSTSYTGYVSPISYSNYEVTVRVYSSDGDDDFNGIVAAFAKDSNGKEHTLSFLRTPNGTGINWTNTGWVCLLDFRAQAKASLSGTTAIIQEIVDTDTNPVSNWRSFYTSDTVGGTVINVKRIGNKFIAKCSAFGSTTLLDSTEIVVDLDDTSLTTQYPTLNLFRGSSPWGYSTYSQANSRYANISITDDSRRIFDSLNDEVWSYGTSGWEIEVGKKPITEMGIGRLNFNTVTKKLFYNNGREIQELSVNSSTDNTNLVSANNNKITLTQNGTTIGEFTLNQDTDESIDIPAGTSYTGGSNIDITDSGVITAKVDSSLSSTSILPVQNNVVNTALSSKVTNGRGVSSIYFVDDQTTYDNMQHDSNTLYIIPIENDNT